MKNVNITRAYALDKQLPEIPRGKVSTRVLVFDPGTRKWYAAAFVWIAEDSVAFWHIEGPDFYPSHWCHMPRDPK